MVVGVRGGQLAERSGATFVEFFLCVGHVCQTRGKSAYSPRFETQSREENTSTLELRQTGNACAPSRTGARPAPQIAAKGFNPKRRGACLLAAATPTRKAPAKAIAG